MNSRQLVILALPFALAALAFSIVACGTGTPSPRLTPLPTRAQPEDLAQQALAEALSELEYDLTQARSLLSFLAKSAPVNAGSAVECSNYVRQLLATNPQYTQLGAATPDGMLFCDSETPTRRLSVATSVFFSRAKREHTFVVGEYVIGGLTLSPSMGLAYPVLDESRTVRAVVVSTLRLSWLAQRFSEINIPVTGEMVVIDTGGNLLLRDPDASNWLGKNLANSALGTAMLTNLQGKGEFAGADGEIRYYAFGSPRSSNKRLVVAVGIKE